AVILYYLFPDSFSFMVEHDSHSAHKAFMETKKSLSEGNKQIATAFKTKTSDIKVKGFGTITEVLGESVANGKPVQRMIVELPSGQHVVVEHAVSSGHPKIRLPVSGADLEFSGVYTWNDSGGVIGVTTFVDGTPPHSGWVKYQDILHQ
ncbi:MAG: DUF3465 domain-containing protein, partial [Victivallales bacterium]|nr:DUF3465 domain-containing protein [Victivallales bacterium]